MKRYSVLARLACLSLLLAGCGNLSNEDLLFLAAVPRPSDLELAVTPVDAAAPAATGDSASAALTLRQALVGQPAEFYLRADEVAQGINGTVAGVLGFIDRLGSGHPPTKRTANSRVWGPVHNFDGQQVSIRLEIDRTTRDDGGVRFVFCLHMTADAAARDAEPSCAEAGAWHAALFGFYDPDTEQTGARAASGTVTLDFEAKRLAGDERGTERGTVRVNYDFSAATATRQLHVESSVPSASGAGEPRTTTYDYSRAAERVDFYFAFQANLVGGGWGNLGSTALETATLDASWSEGGPGRADAVLVGGDIAAGESVTATECWGPLHRRAYYRLTVSAHPAWDELEGNVAACPP